MQSIYKSLKWGPDLVMVYVGRILEGLLEIVTLEPCKQFWRMNMNFLDENRASLTLYWLCYSLPPFYFLVFLLPDESKCSPSSNFQIIFHTSLVFWHYCFRAFCLNNSQVSISFLPLNPGFSSCFMNISIWLFRYNVLTKLVSLVFLISVDIIPNPDLSPSHHMLSVVNIYWFSFHGIVTFLSVHASSGSVLNTCWYQSYNRFIKWVGPLSSFFSFQNQFRLRLSFTWEFGRTHL